MSDEQWLKDLQHKDSILGQAMRAQAKQEALEAEQSTTPARESELQRLRFAMRRERRENLNTPWFEQTSLRIAAAAFLVVGAGLLLRAQWPAATGIDETVMRGARNEIIRSSTVEASARTLAEQLRAAGAQVELTGNAQKTTLRVHFTAAISPAAERALEAYSIAPPPDGRLVVVFIP
jgi:hypothetical protein